MSEKENEALEFIDIVMNKGGDSSLQEKCKRLKTYKDMFVLQKSLQEMLNLSTEDLDKAIALINEKLVELCRK